MQQQKSEKLLPQHEHEPENGIQKYETFMTLSEMDKLVLSAYMCSQF